MMPLNSFATQNWNTHTIDNNTITYNNETINLTTLLTIKNNSNVTFYRCNFMMGSYAKIVCTNSSSLTLNDCTVQASGNDVWNTILVDDINSIVTVLNIIPYTILDAITALTSDHGGQISVENVVFLNCLRGIEIKNFTGSHSAYIAKCIFDGSQIMTKSPYIGNQCEYGVVLNNVINTNGLYSVTIGTPDGEKVNEFIGLINGVYSQLSDFLAINNIFENNQVGINGQNYQFPITTNNYIENRRKHAI